MRRQPTKPAVDTTDELQRLATIASELNADERQVLLSIAERLAMGRRQYGALDIDTDKRDWLEQALEEMLDNNNYLTLALIEVRRQRAKLSPR